MEGDDKKKAHRVSKRKLKKTKDREFKKDGKKNENVDPKIRNPKAFAINCPVRAERKFRRGLEIKTKKERVPQVDRTPVQPPPFIIAIVGPPKVGKSTLFYNIIKNFTRQTLHNVKGPVTIVSGKKRRLTFIECNNDINSMIDTAKIADLVLLLVDASFGFEMEIFEFLNICQVHGFPQIMGVLTHLDLFKNKTQLKKTKKTLKHRFWTEVYPGSKLFYLSGYYPMNNSYPKNEIHNLARFMSVMKFRQTQWRAEHAYVLADRMEDLTSQDEIRINPKTDRNICLYGFIHGTFLKPNVSVHIPGLGDYNPEVVTPLDDPCPLPLKERVLRRSLNEKEKVIYAPFSGVGGIVYDQDAVYIDLGGSHSHNKRKEMDEDGNPTVENESTFIKEMKELKMTMDEKINASELKIFSNSEAIKSSDVVDTETLEKNNDILETISDQEEDENEEKTREISQKNFELIHSADGRSRRKVIFDDDVSSQFQKEVQKLKVGKTQNDKNSNSSKVASQDSESDDNSDSDVEMADVQEAVKLPNAKTKIVTKNFIHNAYDALGLVNKLNQNLSKSDERPSSIPALNNESVPEKEIEFEDEEEENSDLSEEENENDSILNSDESSENEENDEKKENTLTEREYEIGEDPDSISIMKKKRLDEATQGFYSRFKKRSLQKMIYEDMSEYLNVGPKADFDLANCSIEDVQGKNTKILSSEERLKDLFVGGDYAEAAKSLLDDDEELGDFEELDENEEGEDDNEDEEEEKVSSTAVEKEEKSLSKREEMKKKLKEKFDMEYDGGGGDGEEKSFYKDWKSQVEEQTKLNRTFFENIDDAEFLKDLQGLSPGTYVRIQLNKIPCEFVSNFDAQMTCPLIVGSLDSPNQETLAVLQARVKKHRWHNKILKSRDPLLLSVGWRRFQTISIYSVHDHNMRNRMIKYTPEHLHCVANFYGPVTPQGTGILGISPEGSTGFRITLTGTILDMDKSTELVKKLKLIGHPSKIFKKSAFIDGMFNSQLEVAKFTGAKIKTVSGVRGVIKKPLRAPPGNFRATFEDKILLSDIVFCRTWAKVEVPKFYLSLPNHITPKPRVLKTIGEIKRENQVKVQPNPDNLYAPIQRTVKEFRPLKIPKKLQDRLPYKDKPKVQAAINNDVKRIAVVKEPHERKMTQLLGVMKTRMDAKEARERAEKAKKAAERAKLVKKAEESRDVRQRELRKKIFKTLGRMNKNPDTVPGGGKGPRRPFKKRH